MKKLLSLILVLAMCLCAFAACKPAGGDNKETDPAGDQEQALAGEYAIKVWVAENAVELSDNEAYILNCVINHLKVGEDKIKGIKNVLKLLIMFFETKLDEDIEIVKKFIEGQTSFYLRKRNIF